MARYPAVPRLYNYLKDNPEAEKVFRGMQVEAAATGVEMSKLIGVAETFDTFEELKKALLTEFQS